MKTKNCWCIRAGILVGLLLLFIIGLAYAETVVFKETFCEPVGGLPSGWRPTIDDEATAAIREVPALAPPSCAAAALEMVDQSPAIAPMLERSFDEAVERGAFEFVALNSAEKPGDIYGEIRAAGTGVVLDCVITAGRALKCRNGSSLETIVSDVERGVWHTVRIEWDTATWTYKIMLNGADVTPETGLSFTRQGVPTAVRLKLGSTSKVDQKAYVDQVKVVAY
jgi:hypothetical protein